MFIEPKRACDHCHQPIEHGQPYLQATCAINQDLTGLPGVTANSSETLATKQAELHSECVAGFFATIGDWLPKPKVPKLPTATGLKSLQRRAQREALQLKARDASPRSKP